MVLCQWCNGQKFKVCGAEKILPGVHEASLDVSYRICDPCGAKFSKLMMERSATKFGTSAVDNNNPEKR